METKTKEYRITDFVDKLCSQNFVYDGRWHLRDFEESLDADEVAAQVASDWGVSHNAARDLVKAWKAKKKAEYDNAVRKEIEEIVNFPIPEKVTALLKRLEQVFDISIEFNETPLYLYNRGGFPYAMGKGFTLSHCTSSLADGPGFDYSKEIMEILKPFKFEISRSYGDNGMDSATNWQDTFWYYDIVYTPSVKYFE